MYVFNLQQFSERACQKSRGVHSIRFYSPVIFHAEHFQNGAVGVASWLFISHQTRLFGIKRIKKNVGFATLVVLRRQDNEETLALAFVTKCFVWSFFALL